MRGEAIHRLAIRGDFHDSQGTRAVVSPCNPTTYGLMFLVGAL